MGMSMRGSMIIIRARRTFWRASHTSALTFSLVHRPVFQFRGSGMMQEREVVEVSACAGFDQVKPVYSTAINLRAWR